MGVADGEIVVELAVITRDTFAVISFIQTVSLDLLSYK